MGENARQVRDARGRDAGVGIGSCLKVLYTYLGASMRSVIEAYFIFVGTMSEHPRFFRTVSSVLIRCVERFLSPHPQRSSVPSFNHLGNEYVC